MMLKARRNELQYASSKSSIHNNDNVDKDLHSECVAATVITTSAASSNSLLNAKKGENCQVNKEEIAPIENESQFHQDC